MIDAGSLRSLFTLSMRKRVFGGFAVVLVLLAALALVGLRGMESVRVGAARVSQDSAQANASTEVALQVADAHARVVQYALSATMDDQKVAQASLIRLDQTVERSGAAAATRAPTCVPWQRAIAATSMPPFPLSRLAGPRSRNSRQPRPR